MATKNFDTAARRGDTGVNNPVDIEFSIDGTDVVAHPPTTGQLALFIASTGGGGMTSVQAMFDFLGAILDDEGFDLIEEKLNDGVELALITDVITYLIEEWSARPTQQSSESTASRRSTGKRSTAKRPAAAKTPSS